MTKTILTNVRKQVNSLRSKWRILRQLTEILFARETAFNSNPRISQAVDSATGDWPVPVLSFSGTAFECGRNYANWVLSERPDHVHRLVHSAWATVNESDFKTLFASRGKNAMDFSAGIGSALTNTGLELPRSTTTQNTGSHEHDECTSFAVAPKHTLGAKTISGQTKDTSATSLRDYILLILRPTDAPHIAVLTYPGELLGYGLWGTGISLFRNSIHSSAGSTEGLDFHQLGLLCLSQPSIAEIRPLIINLKIKGKANLLITDKKGESISVEFNAAGTNILEADKGIITHANHCEGQLTGTLSHYPDKKEEQNSEFRARHLRDQLVAASPTLTPQRIYSILSDHTRYPQGICRHQISNSPFNRTTATIIAENSTMSLHVSLGNPCQTWPKVFELNT
ncbi:MAG: hypothetical protein RL563_2446 [Pseudomonadota bacterium]|jgi:hypothetical protein